ncbi:hypothetical protein [Pseudoalteromonas pernae]|uniref:hypothetical protein n=1 Tax=Pseudoalteromonas pernae TaxID=3118054 RepID=UPI0032428706
MGLCLLTGKKGKFVKSHIIPKSLTRPSKAGNKFLQPAAGSTTVRLIKRADSWYDKSIVIREGEDYLSEIDSYAIDELRAQGLLWSSDKLRKPASDLINELTIVNFNEPLKIRKFFLSLLWRAAVSSLPEFVGVTLSKEQIEILRRIIIGEMVDTLSVFPIILIQLTGLGPTHNFVPIKLSFNGWEVYRFYVNGLIAHIHLQNPNLLALMNPVPSDHPTFLGTKQTIVHQVKTENSFQLSNLKKLLRNDVFINEKI